MVLRADGKQVGVQIDENPSRPFTEETLVLKAVNPFDPNTPPDGLQGVELSLWRITVGIMPGGEPHDNKEKWVCVVAVCEKHPAEKVYFVATQHRFADEEDDDESNNFPRIVTFAELQQKGALLGRFEGCTESDILWYTDYMQDNHGALPAASVAFPSAEAHGPRGEKGGYDDQGKAIKIKEDV